MSNAHPVRKPLALIVIIANLISVVGIPVSFIYALFNDNWGTFVFFVFALIIGRIILWSIKMVAIAERANRLY